MKQLKEKGLVSGSSSVVLAHLDASDHNIIKIKKDKKPKLIQH